MLEVSFSQELGEFRFAFFAGCRGLIEGTSQQTDRTKFADIVC
jgi:hypothetical protein